MDEVLHRLGIPDLEFAKRTAQWDTTLGSWNTTLQVRVILWLIYRHMMHCKSYALEAKPKSKGKTQRGGCTE